MNQYEKKTNYSISLLVACSVSGKSSVNVDLYTSLFAWLRENNRYIKVTNEYKDEEIEENIIVSKNDFFDFLNTIDF